MIQYLDTLVLKVAWFNLQVPKIQEISYLCPGEAKQKSRQGGEWDNTIQYTEDAGLPYFDLAAVKAKGNWYYSSALEPMGAKLCFCYSSITIGHSYK